MWDELPFRICVLSLAIAFQAARWPTRHLVGRKAAWEAMKKNPRDGIVLSICSVLWTSSVVQYSVLHPWLQDWQVKVPDFVRWMGIVSGIAAVGLTRWADVTMGKNLSIIVQVKADQTLVTQGPYRWIRHPIYAGTVLFALMLVLTPSNVLIIACAVTAAVLLLGTRIFEEERLLTERFGDQYRDYMRSTGRLVPRLFPRAKPKAHCDGPHFLSRDEAMADRGAASRAPRDTLDA